MSDRVAPGGMAPTATAETRIILCGASVRSLAVSALRGGYDPVCFDQFADADLLHVLQTAFPTSPADTGRLFRIPDFRRLPDSVLSWPQHWPIVWSGGLENHPDILQQLFPPARPRGGIAPQRLPELRDPQRLTELAEAAGLSVPRRCLSETAAGAGKWLQKSRFSSGGLGILLWGGPSGAAMDADHYLQEFISGVPVSALLCTDGSDVRLLQFTLQFCGLADENETGFQYCGNVGPVRGRPEWSQQVLRLSRALVQEFDLRGVFGLDLVLRHGQLWFLEINPRITASHEIRELVSGESLVAMHLSAVAAGLPRPQVDLRDQGVALKYVLYAGDEIVVDDRCSAWVRRELQQCPCRRPSGPVRYTAETDFAAPAVWHSDLPQPGTRIAAGAPICTVLCADTSLEALAERLRSTPAARCFPTWVGYGEIADRVRAASQRFAMHSK